MPTKNQSTYRLQKLNTLRAYHFPTFGNAPHAVFTRLGGRSPEPWRSLNLSRAVGDDPANIAANFALACAALNINPAQTADCHLVHGHHVFVIDQPPNKQHLGKGDIIISNQPNITLTMRFADCVPILLYDPVVRAIGLAHAGWRGTMQNVMSTAIRALGQHFGSRPADVRALVGPSIGPCCYQVGDDVYQTAQTAFDEPQLFFQQRADGRYFDLWAANDYQARQAGAEQVIKSNLCTACHTDHFFSHRAEKGKTGRFAVFLGLPAV